MPFSSETGIRIHYEITGSGPPLVLVHANPFDRRLWLFQAARYAQHYTVVNVDIRGYGFSDKPETPFGLRDMADDVLGVCRREKIDRAVFAGVSVGSGISLLIGLDDPGIAKGLILVGGSSRGGGSIQARIDGYLSADLAGYRRAHMRELFAPAFPDTPRGQWTVDMFCENSPTLSGRCIAQIFRARAGCTMTPRLAGLRMPVLVINGEHDGSMAGGRETAAGIPGARHAVVPATGHACCIEDPAAFDRPMEGFLRDNGLWP